MIKKLACLSVLCLSILTMTASAQASLLQTYHEGCMKGCLAKWKNNCLKMCNCAVEPFRGSSDMQIIKLLNACKIQNKTDACKNYHLRPKTRFVSNCKPK